MLTKTTVICEQEVVDSLSAVFSARNLDSEAPHLLTVVMPKETWERLGCPVAVTASIKPDDTLNDGEGA